MTYENYHKDADAISKIIRNSRVPVIVMLGFLETEKHGLIKRCYRMEETKALKAYLDSEIVKEAGKADSAGVS